MIISLRIKILAIVLVFLSLLGAAFLFYSLATTVNLKELRLEGIVRLVEHETEKVNKVITEIERGAVFFAQGAKIIFDARVNELGETFAYEYLNSFQTAVGAGFWYEPYAYRQDQMRAGFYAFFDKNEKRVKLDDTFFIDEYDYHNKSWYKEISNELNASYQVVWTMPYADDSGSYSLMTTAGSGIFDGNGKLLAISTVDWEISEIVSQLLEIRPTKNSYILLCAPQDDYIISGTYASAAAGSSIKNLPWDIFSDSFIFNDANYMSFGQFLDNGWYLSIQIPENEIFADVESRNGRYSTLIAVSSVIMLLGAYLLITAFINKPLKKLTSEVALIEPGNLERKIEISSKDELGQLALTFNKMTGELKNSIEENVREREEKKRISTELSVAHDIQTSMLPSIFPPFPDRKEFDLFASMNPARDVGGDFYDFFFVDNDNLAVVIADVSGKGVPAALFMVISKTLIKNSSSGGAGNFAVNTCSNATTNCKNAAGTLDEIIKSVNIKLCEGNETGMFVTVFMGIYNIPEKRLIYVNAGHNPPLVKKKDGKWKFLKTQPCKVLAFLENSEYKHEEISLEYGDILYLYTDGVTEAMNSDKDLFGEERLAACLEKCDKEKSEDILNYIKHEIDDFSGGAEQADDITMLALRITDNNAAQSRITVKAQIKNLGILMNYINSELDKYDYSADYKNEIGIAIEEIFINISYYAFAREASLQKARETTLQEARETTLQEAPDTGDVTVSISTNNLNPAENSNLSNLQTVIKFEDSGIPFNPLLIKEPDLNEDLIERGLGGLGIHIVKKIMDTIDYYRKDGKNILIITRNHP